MFELEGGSMYPQQQAVQQFAQPVQNLGGFGQQNSFPSQPSGMGQMNQMQGQIGMPGTNQLNIATNQIGLNSSQMVNPLASSLHMGAVNQINGLPGNAMTMQSQMVRSNL